MDFLWPQGELLSSYKRCNIIGVDPSTTVPLIMLNPKELEIKIYENKKLIDTFYQSIEEEWIIGEYLFLLTDVEGYLLEVKCSTKEERCIKDSGFKPGVSFKEESCGTNAISMAMRLKRLVYIRPQEHYCNIFKRWYCIASPITTKDGEIIGYIDISTIDKKIANEIVMVIKLLGEKIANEYEKRVREEELNKIKIKLNDKQMKILTLEAKGYKELAIAEALRIEVVTVKYHKRKIVEKLEAKNIQEAVAKAIKLGLIEMN
ncbi:LuxR family transcriptional regulator [Thermoanaerobacter wiegelii]|uniref:Transcriptional regulator, LuxR family n=1 Tax=Thermoanaerobacter wiegelii Rt8.B1 TaxID=697303 RepID=G2MW53_9THEO|nr:helix-turn-helix transcriptional regulator [Thermoanaerobacter wiegelii]AEM77941.1 transcriptional regulator, LuxR family [Thermoanaerobacter wiegelii Rt8.B1]